MSRQQAACVVHNRGAMWETTVYKLCTQSVNLQLRGFRRDASPLGTSTSSPLRMLEGRYLSPVTLTCGSHQFCIPRWGFSSGPGAIACWRGSSWSGAPYGMNTRLFFFYVIMNNHFTIYLCICLLIYLCMSLGGSAQGVEFTFSGG